MNQLTSKTRTFPVRLGGPALAAALLAAGLSGPVAAGDGPGSQGVPPAAGFGVPGQASAVTRTITVVLGPMSFTPDRIEVKAGETIRFELRNLSANDHDFTLGDSASQLIHQQEMAKGLAHGHGGAQGGNSVDVPAGRTAELLWRFTTPGTLEFDCDVPGHSAAGMKGSLSVVP
jgi:uncharacterized cupredoxin-like copper-binding protein